MSQFGFCEATHTYTIDGVTVPSVTEICAPITAAKYQAGGGVITNAASRGSRIHELCELYDYDALPDEFEADLAGYMRAWAAFTRDYKPTWTHIEHRMYSESELFAGTADRIGYIDGKPVKADIKSTSGLDRASKIALAAQLAGYDRLGAAEGIPRMEFSLGVQLKRDGTYTIHDSNKTMQKYGFDADELFTTLLKFNFLCKGEPHGRKRIDDI